MLRSIATLLSGNALSQLVNVATILLVVSALFSPAEFGTYAVLMSYVGILSSVACLRYEVAIVSAEGRIASNNLVFASAGIAIIFSTVVYGAFKLAASVFGTHVLLGEAPAVIAGTIFLRALDLIGAAVLYRREAYLTYSILKLIQSIVLFGGFVAFGRAGVGAHGLLLATGFAYAAFAAAALIATHNLHLHEGLRRSRITLVVRKYFDFVRYNTPHVFIDNCLAHGLNFVLVLFAGPSVVGYFNFVQRVVKAPLGLILGAVSQVLFRSVAKSKSHPGIVTRKLLQALWVAGVIVALAGIIVFLAYILFPEIHYFRDWSGLRDYMLPFALWMLVPFIFSSFSLLPVVYGRQRQFFFLAATFNATTLLLLAALTHVLSVTAAFFSVALISLIYYACLTRWMFNVARGNRVE